MTNENTAHPHKPEDGAEVGIASSALLSRDPSVRGGYKAGWIGVPRENCPTKVRAKRSLWLMGWTEGRKVLERDNELRKKLGINF